MQKIINFHSAITLIFLLAAGIIDGIAQTQTKADASQANLQITGTVVDNDGAPVSGVRVSSMITDRPPRGRTSTAFTDAKGRFILQDVEVGNNLVFAEKPEDGYASNLFDIRATSVPTEILVNEEHPRAEVTIRLGQKSPTISGEVIDKATGKPVKDVSVTICGYDDRKNCLTMALEGKFNILVPIKPFTLKVSSANYEDWTYTGGTGENGECIVMTADTTKEITIQLSRENNPK